MKIQDFGTWAASHLDEEPPPSSHNDAESPKQPIDETKIECESWWRDPATIPPRQSLYGRHYIRRTIGATIGAGGRAKTTLSHLEAVSMAAGRDLMTSEALPDGPLRVWCLNGEEDQDELDRRVAATCQHYDITKTDLGGRLFVKSVRDRPIRVATLIRNVPTLNQAVVDQMTKFIEQKKIDVFMLDPFVSFHGVAENDNMAMDLVIKEALGAIANKTNSAGEIFHHPGKPKPGQAETSVEDGRGASAILWAVRNARVLNFMTPEEAAKLGISEDDRRLHIRIANGKANMGPLGKAKWMKLLIEQLQNGDEVACVTSWKPPNPFHGVTTADMQRCRTLVQGGAYRVSSQSSDWVGYLVAEILKIDVTHGGQNDPKDIARIKEILRTWFKNNVLATEKRPDKNRHERDFVIPGLWRPEAEKSALIELDSDEFTLQ
jgi:hypothetical protein